MFRQAILLIILCWAQNSLASNREITYQEIAELSANDEEKNALFKALNKASNNAQELIKAIKIAPDLEQKSAVIFLISHMPERDLRDLTSEYLLKNVKWSFHARATFPWAAEVPMDIFLNDVLPYATFNERRDDWRQDFFERFSPLLKKAQTIEEAAEIVSKNMVDLLQVKYSTKRKKADQSPYESIQQGLASCTGLSILTTNAFRSVGIPSRIIGTPAWTTVPGNHNWNEIYLNGHWFYMGYYSKGKLNQRDWTIERAGKADGSKWQHRIYASSFKAQSEHWFPLVWDLNIRYVNALNLTQQYHDWWQEFEAADQKKLIKNSRTVAVIVYDKKDGKRVPLDIRVEKEGTTVASGRSRSEINDMNNMLEFQLVKETLYQIIARDEKGNEYRKDYRVENQPHQKVILILK